MMKFAFIMKCVTSCLLFFLGLSSSAQAEELSYQATGIYTTDDLGQVLSQGAFAGWLALDSNGSYSLDFQGLDHGQYLYMPAGGQQARETILFNSSTGYQFMAYPQGDLLAVWLTKTADGANLWVALQRVAPAGAAAATATDAAAPAGTAAFDRVVMYGTTSAPTYSHYNPATGYFYEDQKGLILRPDGTYYLKADFGDTTTVEEGNYRIAGNQVLLTFSDGSVLALTIEEQGRKLNWYSNGILLDEFFYLGEAK
jgi:hypothetical protein